MKYEEPKMEILQINESDIRTTLSSGETHDFGTNDGQVINFGS